MTQRKNKLGTEKKIREISLDKMETRNLTFY